MTRTEDALERMVMVPINMIILALGTGITLTGRQLISFIEADAPNTKVGFAKIISPAVLGLIDLASKLSGRPEAIVAGLIGLSLVAYAGLALIKNFSSWHLGDV